MVSTANCGNGTPMWFAQEAAPELIGKPLETGFPYNLVSTLSIQQLDGYSSCANNATKWAEHTGDPNYNLLNECCKAINAKRSNGNPPAIGFTTLAQRTMDYALRPGTGRDKFVRFWRLVAQAVAAHPSVYACELMNEPMSVHRGWAFDTWRAAAEAINAVVPDMAVAFADLGESALGAGAIPKWLFALLPDGIDVSEGTVEYIKRSTTAFYAWHEHGVTADNLQRVARLARDWNVPSFSTEMYSCKMWQAAKAANVYAQEGPEHRSTVTVT